MSSKTKKPAVAAVCEGVKVPASPLMNEARIERINQSRYEGQEIAGALSIITPQDRVLEMGCRDWPGGGCGLQDRESRRCFVV